MTFPPVAQTSRLCRSEGEVLILHSNSTFFLVHIVVMTRFVFEALCVLVLPLRLLHRLAAMANALPGMMANVNLLLLSHSAVQEM
jgi:hypothetical protein